MCCFVPLAPPDSLWRRLFLGSPRIQVASTSIFARRLDASRQALVYALQLGADSDVAMILPLPVATGSGETALEFLSFEAHSEFFTTLSNLFNPPMPAARGGSVAYALQPQALPVHNVGAFEASFVPTQRDFERLDARFRMPPRVWQEIGDYDDYGFAVFRLAPGKKANVHPMAFQFQTRNPTSLFFPTVHVHDGRVHTTAYFDHSLYYQGEPRTPDERAFMSVPHNAHELLRRDTAVYRRRMYGKLPNQDTWVPLAAV
jgi:hypothetical protein